VRKTILVLLAITCAVGVGSRALGAWGSTSDQGASGQEALSAAAQQKGRTFSVPALQVVPRKSLTSQRLGAKPEIDGDFGDWPIGGGTDLSRNTAFSFQGHISDLRDLNATIRSGWDEKMLYFAVSVADDVVVTDSEEPWNDDGVEIGLDGLYDRYAWGGDDHQYTVVADGRLTDRGGPATGALAAVAVTGGGYNIELAIPINKLLPGLPISGTVMGFTAGLHDDDDGGRWDAYLIWEGTNTSSKPEEYGSLVFTERIEDRIASLEAKIAELEKRTRDLLEILSEFDTLPSP